MQKVGYGGKQAQFNIGSDDGTMSLFLGGIMSITCVILKQTMKYGI
jgi:hypothetical protein